MHGTPRGLKLFMNEKVCFGCCFGWIISWKWSNVFAILLLRMVSSCFLAYINFLVSCGKMPQGSGGCGSRWIMQNCTTTSCQMLSLSLSNLHSTWTKHATFLWQTLAVSCSKWNIFIGLVDIVFWETVLSSPGKCHNKIPGLSRFSRIHTNPIHYGCVTVSDLSLNKTQLYMCQRKTSKMMFSLMCALYYTAA